jgi:hypothetical protein
MRRRNDDDTGSLDMLLDTICNIFGLLIFVAVIAAVLARTRSEATVHVESPKRLPTPASAPVQDAPDVDIETLDNDIAEARQYIGELESALSKYAPPKDGAPQSQDELQHRIESLQESIDAEKSKRMVQMRLPRRRAVVGRVPVQLVIKDDRLYIVNDWRGWSRLRNPQAERCAFWMRFNPDAVDVAATKVIEHEPCYRAGGQDIERWIRLLPDGGIDLSTPKGAAAAKAALRVLDPRTHVASIKVAEDSFDSWSPVRSAVLQRRIPYDVSPITLEPGLVFHDRIRSGTASAQ